MTQLFRHDPENGIYGDCHRAVIAWVLGRAVESVPHFAFDGCDGETFHARIAAFLKPLGLLQFEIPFPAVSDPEDLISRYPLNLPGYSYILGGTSLNGVNHSVGVQNGKIAYDPGIDQPGIVGPCDDGYYWISLIVLRDLRAWNRSVEGYAPVF